MFSGRSSGFDTEANKVDLLRQGPGRGSSGMCGLSDKLLRQKGKPCGEVGTEGQKRVRSQLQGVKGREQDRRLEREVDPSHRV